METADESIHIGSHWKDKILRFHQLLLDSRKYYTDLIEQATKEEILENPLWYANAKYEVGQADMLIASHFYHFYSIIKEGESQ